MRKTTCERIQPELKAYLDGMLSPLLAYRVRRHLSSCEICRHELAEVERIGKEMHSMASDIRSVDGDILDPILRARILAAIPTGPSITPARSRIPFRVRPVMAIGALAAAVLAAVIILPQSPLRNLSPGAAYPSAAKQAMRDEGDSSVAGSSAKSVKQVAANNPATASVSPAARPASALPSGGITASEPPMRFDRAQGGSSGARAAPAAPPATEGAPIDALDNKSAKAAAFVGGKMQDRVSITAGHNANEPHTFTTINLETGESLVRQAAASLHGSVATQPHTSGSNTVELTVTVPASQSAALLEAIPRMSGGALREQVSPTRVSHLMNGAGMGGFGTAVDGHIKRKSEDYAKLQAPKGVSGSGRIQTRASDVAHQSNGSGIGSAGGTGRTGNQDTNIYLANPGAPATETVTIVLVKGR